MRNGHRLFLSLSVAVFVLVLTPSALGDEAAYQFVVPPTGGTGCSGFPHETVDGTVTGCTPDPTGHSSWGFFSVAADGSVVFQANDGTGDGIWLVHPDGSFVELDNSPLDFSPSISYDGTKVVFARIDAADSNPSANPAVTVSDIYSVNSDGSGLQLVASGHGTQYLRVPTISPDGSTVAYWCGPGANGDLTSQGCGPLTDGSYRNSGVMRVNIDGTNTRMIVIGPGDNLEPVGPSGFTWSPDSQWLAMDGILNVDLGNGLSTAQRQLFEYRTDGSDLFNNEDPTRQITHFTYDPNAVFPNSPAYPRFSPDGSELLYMDFVDGNGNEGNFSYLVGADGSNTHQVFLNDGGYEDSAFIPTATPTAPPPLVDMTHITVPSVESDSVSAATSTLNSVNLTVGTVNQAYSVVVPVGAVVSQSPTAGTVAHRTVKVGPPVNLVVSKGAPPSETLTVTRGGTGSGTVSSAPAGISCGTACSHAFAYGATVTLTATPAAGSKFAGWLGACAGAGLCQVTMGAARSVKASFVRARALKVTKAGGGTGTVISRPPGITCGAMCAHAFAYGVKVVLTATASPGSKFVGWSGACSGTGVCRVTMTAGRAVTATFKKVAAVVRRSSS